MRVAVSGAAGHIGGHLVNKLIGTGHDVVAVDIKPLKQWWQLNPNARNLVADLREIGNWGIVACDQIYHLAADFGGRGYIDANEAACAVNTVMDLNMLRAVLGAEKPPRVFYASTACVYPTGLQDDGLSPLLAESDVGPPYTPDGLYGHYKLFSELACKAFVAEHGLDIRVGRLHGVFGAYGSWNDGREKAPMALMRKVALAKIAHEQGGSKPVEIWGDGRQTRTFMHVDDAVDGMIRIMNHDTPTPPLNLGSEEIVSIKEMAGMICDIAGVEPAFRYVDGPVGVYARASYNLQINRVLKWAPSIDLRDGLERTYGWVEHQVRLATQESLAHA